MDGPENQKDPSGTAQDTSGGTKETSGGEPETLTREEAQKQTSDALAAAGRDAKSLDVRGKSLDAREEALKAEQAKITQWQTERDEAEEESLKDDPEGLKFLRKKQALATKEKKFSDDRATLERDEAEHKARLDAAEETEREIVIWEIAQKLGIDASKLKELSTDLNLQTKEQIERAAKEMAAGKAPPKTPLTLDTGKTGGGDKDLSGMSSRQAFRSHLEDKKK